MIGETEGNYTLLTMEIKNGTIEMQMVGVFQQTEHEIPILNLAKTLQFYGNGP